MPFFRTSFLLSVSQTPLPGPSHTWGQKCFLISWICHQNEKPSATGLFTYGQNLVADWQTSKMLWTAPGRSSPNWNKINLGKQKRGCFDSEMICQVMYCSRVSMQLTLRNIIHIPFTNIFRTKCNNFHNFRHDGSILVCLAITCLQMINSKFCTRTFRILK